MDLNHQNHAYRGAIIALHADHVFAVDGESDLIFSLWHSLAHLPPL